MKVEFGWPCGAPLCRSLTGYTGLYEVRSHLQSRRIARVFFTVSEQNMVLSQATPLQQLKLAERRMKEYIDMPEKTPHLGSTLESLLREDGIYEDAKNDAVKAVLAYKLQQAMKEQNLSKARMAERMETSRSQLDRLLDPENEGVTLHTLKRAAAAVGMRLELELR